MNSPSSLKIVLAGCTGFIGQALCKKLSGDGHQLTLLTRNLKKSASDQRASETLLWDGNPASSWGETVSGCDAVINLCGAGVIDQRWTAKRKLELYNSRVKITESLARAMTRSASKPKVLVNASAVGFYGFTADRQVTESYRKGSGFLADLCEDWEHAARQVENDGVRSVQVRIGVVLDQGGGALKMMLPIFRLGLGGPLGDGLQGFPWIHRTDLVEIICHAVSNSSVRGPINAVAPEIVTMREFAKILGETIHRPAMLPAPAWAIKLLLGERSALLLDGQKVIPEKLIQLGFHFKYPTLKEAFQDIIHRGE